MAGNHGPGRRRGPGLAPGETIRARVKIRYHHAGEQASILPDGGGRLIISNGHVYDTADGKHLFKIGPGQSRIFDYRWNGMLQENMKNKEERVHPTQKAIAISKRCQCRLR